MSNPNNLVNVLIKTIFDHIFMWTDNDNILHPWTMFIIISYGAPHDHCGMVVIVETLADFYDKLE